MILARPQVALVLAIALAADAQSQSTACAPLSFRPVHHSELTAKDLRQPWRLELSATRDETLLVTINRTAADVEAAAFVDGSQPLRLRFPASPDSRDRFLVRGTLAPRALLLETKGALDHYSTIDIEVARVEGDPALVEAYVNSLQPLNSALSLHWKLDDATDRTLEEVLRVVAGESAGATVQTESTDEWSKAYADLDRSLGQLRRLADLPAIKSCTNTQRTLAGQLADLTMTIALLSYHKLGDWQKSASFAAEARTGFRSMDAPASYFRAQVLHAAALVDGASEAKSSSSEEKQEEAVARFERARQEFMEARVWYRDQGRVADEAYVENFLGVANHYEGRWAEARENYTRAAQLYSQAAPSFRRALVAQNLGRLDTDSGQHRSARQEYENAKSLVLKYPRPDTLATILENSGAVYSILGEQDKALSEYAGALAIRRAQADVTGEARSLHGLGLAHARMGDWKAADPYLRQAWMLRSQHKEKDRRGWLASGIAMSELSRVANSNDEALGYLEAVQSAATSSAQKGRLALQRAKVLLEQEDYTHAIEQFDQVLQSGLPDLHPSPSLAILGKARALLGMRRYAEAEQELNRGASASGSLQLTIYDGESSYLLARAARGLSRNKDALRLVDEALQSSARLRTSLMSPESRARLLATRREQYDLKIAILLEQADAAARAGLQTEVTSRRLAALAVSEQARAASLASLSSSLRTTTTAPLEAWYGDLDRQLQRIDTLSERPVVNRREIATLRGEALAIDTNIRSTELKQRAERQAPSAATGPSHASIREVVDSLPADVVVLEYFVGAESVIVWILETGTVRATRIASSAAEVSRLRMQIRELAGLEQSAPDLRARLARLGATLVTPHVNLTRASRLVIVPDAELYYVPFAALKVTPSPGSAPINVANRATVTVSPALSVSKFDETDPLLARDTSARVVIVADPVFRANDARVPAGAARREKSVPAAVSSNGQEIAWSRLPGTMGEARSIASTLGGRNTVLLTGNAAHREAVAKAFSQKVTIAHFATHAEVRASDPRLSFLALSAFDTDWKPVPARLYASEIGLAGFKAELVVLSACRTRVGEIVPGESPIGLAHGFLANGSSAVVSTFWPVPDAFASIFMRDFYSDLVANGNAASALRSAQMKALQHSVWNDPFYWGAFTLTATRL